MAEDPELRRESCRDGSLGDLCRRESLALARTAAIPVVQRKELEPRFATALTAPAIAGEDLFANASVIGCALRPTDLGLLVGRPPLRVTSLTPHSVAAAGDERRAAKLTGKVTPRLHETLFHM
jgi:hypothetical protein